MHIVADRDIPGVDTCFGEWGRLTRLPGREIDARAVRDADVLLTRSITRVDDALVADSRLRFVGTCTIGTDHVDQTALTSRGIGFASAPGCNAEAVVDQVLSSLLTIAEREGTELDERRVGVVGVGNVGGRLFQRLSALGIDCLCCDPPRAQAEGDDGYVDLDTLIALCDVICLHTPLIPEGRYATYHLFDDARIEALAPETWLLNAGRGECLDGDALLRRLSRRGDITAILDVWEREPDIDQALWQRVAIATPHVAGYSLDGKLRATHMIYTALADQWGMPKCHAFEELTPPPSLSRLVLDGGLTPWEALRLCVRAVHDVRRDHDRLALACRKRGMGAGFDGCRAGKVRRREFSTLTVELGADAADYASWLAAAGFSIHTSTIITDRKTP
ncbi:4-phosphoerythronate dehydrogenase PdxB [Aidingimonas halophila]|uniref:Erythronate-4-phosphate dehydrogenase n=1 Tax=Aidingimonas halophila TaxID=574349 RepID=A0A1H3ENK4_9GAMM|nr:4-phosphoerythronate dehydrogenase PdxB [Aidingimonas halophila]GHC31456.1 erythronate-4-phosphate dehydrogenase [Aidingimonas halophila]SDX80322.1 4-phosphoerythronate dehydrogenase [Aidingimonas halophila]